MVHNNRAWVPLLHVHVALFMRLLVVAFFVFDLIIERCNVEPIGGERKKSAGKNVSTSIIYEDAVSHKVYH